MVSSWHRPVLLKECIEGLALKPGSSVIDCTLGTGGHTEAILERTAPDGRVLAIDRDPAMIAIARERLHAYENRVIYVHANFADLEFIALKNKFDRVNGIIADLGLNSLHIDIPGRGFSFQSDGPLDMRFDQNGERIPAREIINTFPVSELTRIFQTFGEERYARTIATKIEIIRKQKEIQTTRELAEIIASCVHSPKQKLHPATKVFQALRIFINDELGTLTRMLDSLPRILVPGGRVAIISYHSLEDRIVKQYFKAHSKHCTCPPYVPRCTCLGDVFTPITRKAITPLDSEVASNPRSRSAKLRIVERTETAVA